MIEQPVIHPYFQTWRLYLIYGVIALLAAVGVFISTATHGIGYSPDSFAYLRGAELLFTEGITTPSEDLTKFPPLYSFVLGLLSSDTQLILLFNALLLAANVGLLAYMLTLAEVNPVIALPVLLAVGFAPEMVFRHSMVMSEPLFLFLIQLTLIFLSQKRFWPAVVCAALLPLQRYAGVAVIGACAVYLFLYQDWKRALFFGFLTVIPVAAWLIRSSIVADSAREIIWHPISLNHLFTGFVTLVGRYWFGPVGWIVLALTVINRPKIRELSPPPIVMAGGIFILTYLAFLVVSISLFDFFTPLDSRILSPVLITGWVIVAWFITDQLSAGTPRQGGIFIVIFYMVMTFFVLFGLLRMVQSNQNGVGLARNIRPEHYDIVAALPEDTIVYANNTVIVGVMQLNDERLSDITPQTLPKKYNIITQIDNPAYPAQFQQLIETLQTEQAVILWFDGAGQPDEPTEADLQAANIPYQTYHALRVYGDAN